MKGDSVKLCDHARQRCAEMNIRTAAVKRIVRQPTICWRTRRRSSEGVRVVASSKEFPEITVVYVPGPDVPVVLTVLWNTPDRYERATYRPAGVPAA